MHERNPFHAHGRVVNCCYICFLCSLSPQTIVTAMSILTPPCQLACPANKSRLEYVLNQINLKDSEFPAVSFEFLCLYFLTALLSPTQKIQWTCEWLWPKSSGALWSSYTVCRYQDSCASHAVLSSISCVLKSLSAICVSSSVGRNQLLIHYCHLLVWSVRIRITSVISRIIFMAMTVSLPH